MSEFTNALNAVKAAVTSVGNRSDGVTTEGTTRRSIQAMEAEINNLQRIINETDDQIREQSRNLQLNEEDIKDREERALLQGQEIDNKRNLIMTRDRMLQLSHEKNIYKRKVIFTLISLIFLIIIIMIAVYVYNSKK